MFMKNNKIKNIICTLIMVLICTITFYGCSFINKTNNIITNEITNKVVTYEDLNVLDLQTAIQTATEKVENAVVGIVLKKVTDLGIIGTSEDDLGYGSGVIYKAVPNMENDKLVSYTYYVVTNRHVVVYEDSSVKTEIYVYLGNEDIEIPATILGYDSKVDVACVTFESTTYIQPVEFGDSSELKKGTIVIAVGNPEGFDYYGSVTMGIVSYPLRYVSSDTNNDGINDFYAKYIQHDASINPGNSGGGLFTLDGKLVGINTMKLVVDNVDNMGFALTSNEIKELLELYLEEGKTISRPRLGITGIDVKSLTPAIIKANNLKDIPDIYGSSNQKYGIYVSGISVNGSCYNTDLAIDDIILEINGVKIKSSSEISIILNSSFVGEEMTLKYYSRSQNKIKELTIILKSNE